MNKESKLESLRLLFSPNFDDNDLLSILEEAQDDLDLAIARISEGQTATWELRKPKIKNPVRGRGGHRSQKSREPREPKEPREQKEHREPREPREFREKEHKDHREKEKSGNNTKAGLVGALDRNNFQKKKKVFEKKEKTSWAQLVKGPEDIENQVVTEVISQKSEVVSNKEVSITLNVAAKKNEEKKIINTKNSLVVTLSKQVQKEEMKENSSLPPGLLSGTNTANGKKSAFKQQEPVVMPQNSHMSSMGVQFGSLKVSKEEKNLAEKVAVVDSKRIKTPLKNEAAPQNTTVPSGVNMMQSYPSMTPMNYFQQMPGFGMMAPGNGDFQQVYGAEGVQGYYSNHYAKFPSASQNAQPTSTVESSHVPAASNQNPQQMGLHQQQYAMPFGYYPYYMPNQYQNAPGAHPSYGGQFVNKNIYHYGASVSGAPAVTASLTTSALPVSSTQSSSRNSSTPVTATAYPFVSAPPLYGAYDESPAISGTGAAPSGNIQFQNLNSGFAKQSNNTQSQANAANRRSSASGSNASGQNFSNQRPAYDKFSNSVSSQSTNENYYNPDQPSFGNQYQHQQHQHQQYYMQHQQPQQVVYGAYNNGRNTQQNLQYWTATSNGGQ